MGEGGGLLGWYGGGVGCKRYYPRRQAWLVHMGASRGVPPRMYQLLSPQSPAALQAQMPTTEITPVRTPLAVGTCQPVQAMELASYNKERSSKLSHMQPYTHTYMQPAYLRPAVQPQSLCALQGTGAATAGELP